MSRPGQIKGHKTSCKHSDSLYKMDPSKSSQDWLSQEVFYLKSFLFPWRRASMNFKWKPSLRLKRTQLQQSSCSLSCHQQRLISPGARRVLLLHCSCTSLQLASYPCFHWPLKNSILLGKKKPTPKPLKNCSLLLSLPRLIHCTLGSLPPQPK